MGIYLETKMASTHKLTLGTPIGTKQFTRPTRFIYAPQCSTKQTSSGSVDCKKYR